MKDNNIRQKCGILQILFIRLGFSEDDESGWDWLGWYFADFRVGFGHPKYHTPTWDYSG